MGNRIVNERKIHAILRKTAAPSKKVVLQVLEKARQKKGLLPEEVGYLVNLKDKALIRELFKTAGWIKKQIYGERLVFFAPLYISDYCVNDCAYCNFHSRNKELKRRKLTLAEVEEQTRQIIAMGHKRILLECGEHPSVNTIDYIVKVIKKIYSVKTTRGNIRRLNVNIAATTTENYRKLKAAKIGTYQLFQETYHRRTYLKLHRGPKADYDRQITAFDRAFAAGIDDVGIGVLFGLYDWKFEVLALLIHARYLDTTYNIGPHTISVPRFRPAESVFLPSVRPVSDEDFLKLIAIIRIAVPYTGMIISTRESSSIRRRAYQIGISQSSAGSRTAIGGYGEKVRRNAQFAIQDERPLAEVIDSILDEGLLPSFCTACYRLGRTGEAFMDISKHGHIHEFCRPNGLLTFAEYLHDYADKRLFKKGDNLIRRYLEEIPNERLREETAKRLKEIQRGKRDLYF